MKNEWKEYILLDLVEMQSQKVDSEFININNYVSTENMLPDKEGIRLSAGLPNQNNFLLFKKDDVLFSNIRTYFRKVWKASFDGGASNDVIVFRTKDNSRLHQSFLYHLIADEKFIEFTVKTAKGTKMPRGDKAAMKGFGINIPESIPEQKAIAKILGDLDDKIELNRQMNQTLEQMAQAMFKSWFVDFDPVFDNALTTGKAIPEKLQAKAEKRKAITNKKPLPKEIQELFPDEFEFTEEMGFIPKGWTVDVMMNLFEISSAKRIFAKEYQEEGIPFFRGKEITKLSNGGAFNSEIYISNDKYLEIKNKYEVPKSGDILLTSVGTLGNTYLVKNGDEFYFKDGNLTWFKGYKSVITPEFLKIWFDSKLAKKAIEDITIGSTQQAITINSLNNILLLISSEKVINFYTEIIKSNNLKINKNQKQIEKLTQVRDTLLPKLISGELRVPEVLIEKE